MSSRYENAPRRSTSTAAAIVGRLSRQRSGCAGFPAARTSSAEAARGHAQLNLDGALRPDGRELVLLVGVHEAGDVQILEFPSLQVRRQFHAFRGYSELVRFGPGGRLAVASGSDGKLVVFRTADWSRLCELNGNPIHPSGVAISPDERTLAVCSVRGQVHLWHLPTGS